MNAPLPAPATMAAQQKAVDRYTARLQKAAREPSASLRQVAVVRAVDAALRDQLPASLIRQLRAELVTSSPLALVAAPEPTSTCACGAPGMSAIWPRCAACNALHWRWQEEEEERRRFEEDPAAWAKGGGR